MAAACGDLHQIFESSLSDSPASSLIDSFSPWKKSPAINSPKPTTQPLHHSFNEIFGELHFQEPSPSPFPSSSPTQEPTDYSPSSSPDTDPKDDDLEESKIGSSDDDGGATSFPKYIRRHRNSDSFSSMNSESLQMCTEGLGFESFDNVEDLKSETRSSNCERQSCNPLVDRSSSAWRARNQPALCSDQMMMHRRARSCDQREYPPPISCIGRSGKPWVWFESCREDGRFVLRQVSMPAQQFLHACREDGRLRLGFVQPGEYFYHEADEDAVEGEDENEDEVVVVEEKESEYDDVNEEEEEKDDDVNEEEEEKDDDVNEEEEEKDDDVNEEEEGCDFSNDTGVYDKGKDDS